MKRIVVTGLRIFCLILSTTVIWSCTGCGIIIINDMTETSEVTDSDTVETQTPSDTGDSKTDIPDDENHETTDSETEENLPNDILARKYLLSVQRKKFNNITFIITTTDTETIAPQTITSDMSEARIERNQQIEKRFEVELVTRNADINTIYESTKNAVLSDTYYTDLLAIPQYNLGVFYASGLLMNIKNLPYISLTSPYFNQSSVDAASGGFGVYGVSGEAVFNPNRMAGIYMNKNLIREAEIELPYQSVYDGTWTWETLYSISSQVTSSLNSDTGTENIHSITSMLNDETTSNLIFSSSGEKYMSSKAMSIPSVGFSAESVSKQIDTITIYLNDGNRYSGDEQSSLAQFNNGNSVFMIARMYVMSWMTNSKTDWGVLPLPKKSEEQQGYNTLADSNALMFSVPSNSNNVDAASVILQAMNAASYKQITDKFITYYMNSVVRDNDTVNMLEIIMDTQVFDFALMFGNAYSSVKDGTVSAVYRAANGESISDIYNANYSSVTEAMKKAFPMSN